MSEQRIEEIFSRVNSAYYVYPDARPLDAHNDIYWLIEKYIPALRKEKDALKDALKNLVEDTIEVGAQETWDIAAALSEEGEMCTIEEAQKAVDKMNKYLFKGPTVSEEGEKILGYPVLIDDEMPTNDIRLGEYKSSPQAEQEAQDG